MGDHTNRDGRGWREVADRVYQRRYDPCDISVCVVVGADGLAVVDTRCSLVEAREVRDHLRQLSAAPVRWVVNTHAHWDHTWGNAEFVAPRLVPPAQLWGHESVPAAMNDPSGADFRAKLAARSEEWAAKMAELVEVPPDHLVADSHTLELGDRAVHLRHVGRGHTDGDLLIHVPDADALLAGDLVEESGPPAFGSDSFPMDWPATLDRLLGMVGGDTVIVPGHGDPVDRGFVQKQRAAIEAVAEEIRSLYGAGVPVEDALAAGGWTWDGPNRLREAVPRGYAQLDGTLR